MEHLSLRIVVPAGEIFNQKVQSVAVPSTEGQLEILPGHANLVCIIDAGVLYFLTEGERLSQKMIVADGSCEISLSGECVVFAETCISPDSASFEFKETLSTLRLRVESAVGSEELNRSMNLLKAYEAYSI